MNQNNSKRGDLNRKTNRNETNLKKSKQIVNMIALKSQIHNVEYWWIKMIKLFGLDQKSQFEMNNYSFFYLLLSNISKNMSKMSQNAHIWQYIFNIIWL